jgi:hypothetical protein
MLPIHLQVRHTEADNFESIQQAMHGCFEHAFRIERLDFTPKIVFVESGINRSIFIYCLAAPVSFSDPQWTPSREEYKFFQRP